MKRRNFLAVLCGLAPIAQALAKPARNYEQLPFDFKKPPRAPDVTFYMAINGESREITLKPGEGVGVLQCVEGETTRTWLENRDGKLHHLGHGSLVLERGSADLRLPTSDLR